MSMRRIALGFSEFQSKTPFITSKEWFGMNLAKRIQYTKQHGGTVNKWRPGKGWMYVLDFKDKFYIKGENGSSMVGIDSTYCILLAAAELGNKSGIDVLKIYRQTVRDSWPKSIDDLKEWKALTVVPSVADDKSWQQIMAALEDINYHTMSDVLNDALSNAHINANRKANRFSSIANVIAESNTVDNCGFQWTQNRFYTSDDPDKKKDVE